MLYSIVRSSRVLAQRVNTRAFSITSTRANLITDLYVKELKAFKPTPLSAADAEGNTKKWAVPKAPAAPEVEGSTEELASYDSSEVVTDSPAATSEEGAPVAEEDWFVFPEEETSHH